MNSTLFTFIILTFSISIFAYEKKLIDISHLEVEQNIESIPDGKSTNVKVKTYNRDGLIFIDDKYYGRRNVEIALDTGVHFFQEFKDKKVIWQDSVNVNNRFNKIIKLGPKKVRPFAGIEIGYRANISALDYDINFMIATLKGGIVYKNRWTHFLSATIAPFELSEYEYYGWYGPDLDDEIKEDPNVFHLSGYYSLMRQYNVKKYLDVGIGGRVGISFTNSETLFDDTISMRYYIYDSNSSDYVANESFFGEGFARIEEEYTYTSLGGIVFSLGVALSRFQLQLKGGIDIGVIDKDYFIVDVLPFEPKENYDYYSTWIGYNESLSELEYYKIAFAGNINCSFIINF